MKMVNKVLVGLVIYVVLTLTLISIQDGIVTNRAPAVPAHSFVEGSSDTFVMAEGTWAFASSESMHDPIQTTQIKCYKSKGECIMADGIVSSGNSYLRFLTTDITVHPILEWTDSHISFVNDSPSCVFYYYSIDRVSKAVTALRKKKTDTTGKKTEDCDALNEELRLTMRDGFDVWKEETEKAKSKPLEAVINALLFWRGLVF